MPVIGHIDGPSRRIYLAPGVRTFHPIEVYREVRELRLGNEDLRKFDQFMEGGGNTLKRPGFFTPRYFVLLKGTKIIPNDVTHQLGITGEIFTDDPNDSDVFDLSEVSAGNSVFFDYKPPEAEVIVIQQGISGLTSSESTQLEEIHQMHMLDEARPRTDTPTSIEVGSIKIDITGDGVTTSTGTRQP